MKLTLVLMRILIILAMNQIATKSVLSYRNAYYQGETRENYRHGAGLLLMDEGQIVVTQWKQDLAYGPAFAFVNSEEYAFLEFNRGELEGMCLFRSGSELLVMQFNNGRAIDQQLLINHEEGKVKVLTYRNANYQVLESGDLSGRSEAVLIEDYLGIKMETPNLSDYLEHNFCRKEQMFEVKVLPNGTKFFRFNDRSNPISLGFVIVKNDQLTSYGSYINDKLHGFGCKYENNSKYEGQFENGFLNGEGMRYSNGKYSYGRFQNGNLVEALFLEERSTASEERLRELRRITHIQSPNFFNAYVKKGILRFKGIAEVTSMSSPVKEYLYSQFGQKMQQLPIKGSQVSLNQLLSAKMQQGDAIEGRSLFSSSHASQNRHPDNQDHYQSQRGVPYQGGGYPSGRKFNL